MGARKGAARVGACLVPLENNLFVGPFSPSCGEREVFLYQARVQGGGGPRGLPPLEIEKPKKKIIRANFKLFPLYFATFLVENIIFSVIF